MILVSKVKRRYELVDGLYKTEKGENYLNSIILNSLQKNELFKNDLKNENVEIKYDTTKVEERIKESKVLKEDKILKK